MSKLLLGIEYRAEATESPKIWRTSDHKGSFEEKGFVYTVSTDLNKRFLLKPMTTTGVIIMMN